MKKKLHTLLFALLPLAGFAQQIDTPFTDTSPLKLGFNVGATYAGIRGNDQAKANNSTIDYLIGISLEAPLNDDFSLIGNVNYERLALTRTVPFASINDPFDPVVSENGYGTRLTLQHITVPINLKYYIGESKGYYVNGGVFVRYFLGQSVRINGEKVDGGSYGSFQDFTYGINLGLGMRFTIDEKSAINVELRDNLGLSNITRQPTVNGGSVKTNSVNLIVNWQFDF
ncbi:MAG: porin family protein [Bacteroidota bacterium]